MPADPLARIWIHIITALYTRLVYNILCKKGKASIFLHFFGFWGLDIAPQAPL